MTGAGDGRRTEGRGLEGRTEQVLSLVRNLIDRGRSRPGDRLASDRDLRYAADPHRRLHQSLRRDPDRARRAMKDHLLQALRCQAQESAAAGPMPAPKRRAAKSRANRATA